jgi:co-chaperonin GroES (HSP10)
MTGNDFNTYSDPGIDLATFDKEAEIAKFKGVIRAVGWGLYVRLYTEPNMVKSVMRPPSVQEEDMYTNCVGLVVQQGKGAYKDARYADTGPWCEVGDWVVFPRHSGYRILVKGIPIWVLKEDAIDGVAESPAYISKFLFK